MSLPLFWNSFFSIIVTVSTIILFFLYALLFARGIHEFREGRLELDIQGDEVEEQWYQQPHMLSACAYALAALFMTLVWLSVILRTLNSLLLVVEALVAAMTLCCVLYRATASYMRERQIQRLQRKGSLKVDPVVSRETTGSIGV